MTHKNMKKNKKNKPINTTVIQVIAVIGIMVIMVGVSWILIRDRAQKAEQSALAEAVRAEQVTALQNAKSYAAPTDLNLDIGKKYTATFKLAKGSEFVVELYLDKAPITVNSFVFLAREGYFNGTTFHRVLEGFMAQGGDPTGTGMGGPGYQFPNEDSDLTFDKPGVLAMANAGRDTNGSQFFITFVPTPQLNGGYTIFGQVVSGMDVVNGITRRDPQLSPNYEGDVIESITISEE